MKSKFLGFIEKDTFTILHYIPLVGAVFGGYYLSVWLNLMELVVSNPVLGWTSLAGLYYFVLLIVDQLVHTIFRRH